MTVELGILPPGIITAVRDQVGGEGGGKSRRKERRRGKKKKKKKARGLPL